MWVEELINLFPVAIKLKAVQINLARRKKRLKRTCFQSVIIIIIED
jgi:hypothetical protein